MDFRIGHGYDVHALADGLKLVLGGVEIVSEPDMRSGEEVIAYLEKLRLIIQYLGASDCKLQEGSMRADVNISVREVGTETLGTRTEMKNLNSFRAITKAIEAERNRQIDLLEEMAAERDDLERYLDLFGVHPKYGMSGRKISSVTYRAQPYERRKPLYELE